MRTSFSTVQTFVGALVLTFTAAAGATVPTPDPSFAGGHPVTQAFLDMGGGATRPFIQRDGKIVVSGSYVYGWGGRFGDFPLSRGALGRYRPDGALDRTFGVQGIVDQPTTTPALLLRDGRFVGLTAHGLARFFSDYSPDASMATNGAESIAWYTGTGQLLEQPDGKVVVASSVGAGTAVLTLVRFALDGTLDASFNHVGALIVDRGPSSDDVFAGAVLQPDGKIVVAATSNVGGTRVASLLRFLPDGTPDPAFGTNGRALLPNTAGTSYVGVASLARQPNGRLLVAIVHVEDVSSGMDTSSLRVIGVTPSGALDPSYGIGGRFVYDAPLGLANTPQMILHPDGKALLLFVPAAGEWTNRPTLLRLTVDGRADATFGSNGLWLPSDLAAVRGMALQADGQLLLAGGAPADNRYGADFAVARYSIGASPMIEFYNATLDHYFITLNPTEAADLDDGIHVGWARTGSAFAVFGAAPAAPATFVPVCRFYIPPALGDSHFFTASAEECAEVQAKMQTDPNYRGYVFESPDAFYVALPDRLTGACPPATIPVYRLWNQRVDSNHRYVTDPVLKAQMIARGYLAEGFGPDPVAMCAEP